MKNLTFTLLLIASLFSGCTIQPDIEQHGYFLQFEEVDSAYFEVYVTNVESEPLFLLDRAAFSYDQADSLQGLSNLDLYTLTENYHNSK